MYVLVIVLLVLFLIALIPIRLVVRYDADGFRGFVGVLFIKIRFPRKKKNGKVKTASANKTETDTNDSKKSYGKLKEFTWMIKPVLRTLGKLARMITIKRLEADIIISSENAASTAMLYGGASVGIGTLFPILDTNIKIKKKKIFVAPDFQSSESMISVYSSMYIRFWKLIVITVFLLRQMINKKRNSDKQKGIEENG